MKSPFKYGKVIEPIYFVNRKEKINYLQNNFISKTNTILISPRRWGKSSLIEHASKGSIRKNKKIKFIYLDIFNIRSESEFYEVFTKEIFKVVYTKWEDRINKSTLFFKQVIPKFSYGIDPQNDFSVSFNRGNILRNPSEVLHLPEVISKEKNIEIVICIDDFQNIAHFDAPLEFQKKLRAHWQNHQLATYCLCGSKRTIMTEIFEHRSMPFYKFGDVLFLKKVSTKHWSAYIIKRFHFTKKKISEKSANQIIALAENHFYYTQQLVSLVWFNTKIEVMEKTIYKTMDHLVTQYEMMFQREIDNLTNLQINFVKAIINNEKKLSNKDTIKKYRLGTPSNVSRAKKGLIIKEIIDIYNNEIEFIDPLFKYWIKNNYMKK